MLWLNLYFFITKIKMMLYTHCVIWIIHDEFNVFICSFCSFREIFQIQSVEVINSLVKQYGVQNSFLINGDIWVKRATRHIQFRISRKCVAVTYLQKLKRLQRISHIECAHLLKIDDMAIAYFWRRSRFIVIGYVFVQIILHTICANHFNSIKLGYVNFDKSFSISDFFQNWLLFLVF